MVTEVILDCLAKLVHVQYAGHFCEDRRGSHLPPNAFLKSLDVNAVRLGCLIPRIDVLPESGARQMILESS
jgi:hypothetical protein